MPARLRQRKFGDRLERDFRCQKTSGALTFAACSVCSVCLFFYGMLVGMSNDGANVVKAADTRQDPD